LDTLQTEVSRAILAHSQEIAEKVTARQCALEPDLWEPYGRAGREKGIQDVNYHLLYLAEALAAQSPALFADYLGWAKVLFTALKLPPGALATNITLLRAELTLALPAVMQALVQEYLDEGLRHLSQAASEPPSFLEEDQPLAALAGEYLAALVGGERQAASKLILGAVNQGVKVKDIYLQVFQPCQREIGRLWQLNRLSVGQEHYCTAATQWIMVQLYPYIFATPKTGRRFIGACVAGELHEMGLRMVADFFEMEGWDTYYVGANTPVEGILQIMRERGCDILGVSATMTFHIGRTAELIERVRRATAGREVKIMVGGYPFNLAPQLFQQVGADCHARDAREALELARRLLTAVT
jgi:MerR family transcriptional regulator, light-induced transcriptional regulator